MPIEQPSAMVRVSTLSGNKCARIQNGWFFTYVNLEERVPAR
jgi:hypothetical protein